LENSNSRRKAGHYIKRQTRRRIAGNPELVHQVFQWCFPRNGKTDLRTAAARLAVFVSGLNPRVLDGKTLEEMATELDRTKAALSKTNVHAERHFGIHFTRSRSDTSRAHMAAAQLGHKPTNTKKRTSNQTVTNEPAEGGGQAGGWQKKTVTPYSQAAVTDPPSILMRDQKKQ